MIDKIRSFFGSLLVVAGAIMLLVAFFALSCIGFAIMVIPLSILCACLVLLVLFVYTVDFFEKRQIKKRRRPGKR